MKAQYSNSLYIFNDKDAIEVQYVKGDNDRINVISKTHSYQYIIYRFTILGCVQCHCWRMIEKTLLK